MDATDRLLSPDLLDGLATRPIDEVRTLRAECVEVETGLSYLRRMVQGPLDIVHREQTRRSSGTEGDLATLVEDLPDLLAEHTRSAGVGRLPQTLEMSDADLEELATGLTAFERKISEQRHAYFERIDALQAELTRRYRTGEASVESLLD